MIALIILLVLAVLGSVMMADKKAVSMESIFLGTHTKGSTAGFTGERGFGKTHMAVCLMSAGLNYRMKVITNVVFIKKMDGGRVCQSCHGAGKWKSPKGTYIDCVPCSGYGKIWKWKQETPPGISFVEYASEFFRELSRILYEEPCIVINFFDEFQNSALEHHAKEEGLTKFLNTIQGDQRKWNLANVLSTPVRKNYTAGIRRYMKWEYFKSTTLTKRYNKRWGTNYDLKKGMIFLRHFDKQGYKKIIVEEGPYNKAWDKVRIGDIVFDHESSARLEMASYRHDDFSLKWLLPIYAGKPKAIFPELVYRSFLDMEAGREPEDSAPEADEIAEMIIDNTRGWVFLRPRGSRDRQWMKLTQEAVRTMSGLSTRKIARLWETWTKDGRIVPEHEFLNQDDHSLNRS